MPPKKKVKKVTKKVTKKTSQKVEQHTNVNIKIGDTAKPKRVYKKRTVTSKPEPKQNGNPYNNLIETRYVPTDNSKQIFELVKHLAETKTHPIPHMPHITNMPNRASPSYFATPAQTQFAKDFQADLDAEASIPETPVEGLKVFGPMDKALLRGGRTMKELKATFNLKTADEVYNRLAMEQKNA